MNRREAIKGIVAAPLAGQGSLPPFTMKKHSVIFFSPGTFTAEQSEKPIDSWDTAKAMEMAQNIKERHAATPYGFQFVTRERGPEDFDSHESAYSPMYYLGGKVETLAEIKAKNDAQNDILIRNMECNGWDRVVTNCNSWRWTEPLEKGDVVLDFTPWRCPRESAGIPVPHSPGGIMEGDTTMLPKDQLNPINDTLADFQFRHMVAANSRYNASLWCYVHPMKGKLEFGVQQGPSESFYANLLEAIEAYNNLER